jgi:hypothetical protein
MCYTIQVRIIEIRIGVRGHHDRRVAHRHLQLTPPRSPQSPTSPDWSSRASAPTRLGTSQRAN